MPLTYSSSRFEAGATMAGADVVAPPREPTLDHDFVSHHLR